MSKITVPTPASVNDEKFPSGYWLSNTGYAQSARAMVDGRMELVPFWLPSCTLQGMAIYVSVAGAAGSLLRFGLYPEAADRSGPGTGVVDAGTVTSAGTGFATKALGSNYSHPGGRIWVALAGQGAPATQPSVYGWTYQITGHVLSADTSLAVTQLAGSARYQSAAVSGALPATPSALLPTTAAQLIPQIVLQVA